MKVIYKPSATESIESISTYISENILMPETGIKYAKKLIAFGNSLGDFPTAYSKCKYPNWKKKDLFCSTFDKTWIFAFKIIQNNVVVFYIKNGKLLNY